MRWNKSTSVILFQLMKNTEISFIIFLLFMV